MCDPYEGLHKVNRMNATRISCIHRFPHLEQFRFLHFQFTSLKPVELFKQGEKLLMGDHHFHLLLGSPVSMTNNAYHTT